MEAQEYCLLHDNAALEGYPFFILSPLKKQPVDYLSLNVIIGITRLQRIQSIVTEGGCSGIKILSQVTEFLWVAFQIAR